jgi:serine/threonine protein kinase
MLQPDIIINNRYRVVRLIGEGGMGAVYEVIDLNLEATRALKQTLVSGETYKRAFKHEARLLSQLRHKSLPLVTDFFVDTTGTFLVMEFIPGQDLGTMLGQRDTPFRIAEVLHWMDQLLDALDFLHSQDPQIIHRDIKPQNLKITDKGDIILLDFGLAKSAAVANMYTTNQMSILGFTPQYAPPEQAQQQGTTIRSDLYALAATMYCLLSGTPPTSALERATTLVSNQPDPLRPLYEVYPEIPRKLSNLVMQAMALDPARRPDSAAAMRKELHQIQSQLQLQASPRHATRRKFRPWMLPTLGAIVLTLFIIAVLNFPNWSWQTLTAAGGNDQTAQTTTAAAQAGIAITTREPTVTMLPRPTTTATPDRTQTAAAGATQTAASRNLAAAATQTAAPLATIAAATQTAEVLAAEQASITAELAERAARHLSGAFGTATAQYNPGLEAGLLQNGYAANIINIGGGRGLQPSQSEPTRHTWVRDLDYATSGYGYVLGDMSVLRENIGLFLADVEPNGIVPDVYNAQSGYGLNRAWDSMPNLINAVYVYVAKTGDRAFYRDNRQKLQWIGEWIANLDTDGDGLPDRDVYPYGYYNSIENSVRHTYALAKFYAAYTQLAALEQSIGEDGATWEQRAIALREAFHRPFDEGGYWSNDLAWPVGWRDASQEPVRTLETFGVFEALQSGLITPEDAGYQPLMTALANRLPDLMVGPTPLRLTLNGYPPNLLRSVVREPWKADASAPWIVGPAAPAYAAAGHPEQAAELLNAYTAAAGPDALVWQLVATDGSGREGRGGAWGSAAWFMAVYGGHYGLKLTPTALIIEPHPFTTITDDGVQNLSFQGAIVQLRLDPASQIYRVQVDQLTSVILRPMGNATQIRVNDEPFGPEAAIVLQPGLEYVVTSES